MLGCVAALRTPNWFKVSVVTDKAVMADVLFRQHFPMAPLDPEDLFIDVSDEH